MTAGTQSSKEGVEKMNDRRIRRILATLLLTLLVLAGCNAEAATIPTPALNLATPTESEGEVVVVVVTPTPGEEGEDGRAAPAETTPAAEGSTPAGGEAQAAAAPAMNEEQLTSTGEQVYTANCATCHQPNGEGRAGLYPALNGSPIVTSGGPSAEIQLVLHGRGQMPAFRDALSTEQIAAVISYVHTAWDNNAPLVSPQQVQQVKEGGEVAATGTLTGTAPVTGTTTVTATATPAETATTAAAGTLTATEAITVTATTSATSALTSTATLTPATGTPADETPAATGTPQPPATAGATPQATPAAGDNSQLISRGEEIYARNCASCHQLSGEGTAVYPALTQSEMLTAEDPTAAIEIVLHGRGQMPAFANILSTEEIAAVLSYERNSWDNNAPVVTVAQVEEVQPSD